MDIHRPYHKVISFRRKRLNTGHTEPVFGNDISQDSQGVRKRQASMTGLQRNSLKTSWLSGRNIIEQKNSFHEQRMNEKIHSGKNTILKNHQLSSTDQWTDEKNQ